MNFDLKEVVVSPNQQFHLYYNKPLYNNRFIKVGKFHEPGLAPVIDISGAFHINLEGDAAYSHRYKNTYGFYCGIAAVKDFRGAFHINEKGEAIYSQFYDWVGNYQEKICVVRDKKNFLHIDNKGQPIYDNIYEYVGDFKDGIAVVYKNGFGTHINKTGEYIHDKWFKSLDIFHKNYSRAQDDDGWFHINENGIPLYNQRYKTIEPFYNDLALVETFDNKILQIDPRGETNVVISEKTNNFSDILSSEMVGFWKTFIYSTVIKLGILSYLPASTQCLTSKISMPYSNIFRILKASWDAGIIEYDIKNDLWSLTPKGSTLKAEGMSSAAIMWEKVATEDWPNLNHKINQPINSHPSFKDKENNKILIEHYQKALDYYALKDIGTYIKIINFENHKNILSFGRSSLGLMYKFLENSPGVNLTIYVERQYFTNHQISNTKAKQISSLESIEEQYDTAYLIKYIHYFDDLEAIKILAKLSSRNIQELHIFETLVSNSKPNASILDINMLIETGGKLRTFEEWEGLLFEAGYKITSLKDVTPYLNHLIAIKTDKVLCH